MRVSEAGLALIQRLGPGGVPEYLTQWNEKWQRFSLVGGHREPAESFRECCAREVMEELELVAGRDFRVAPEPIVPMVQYQAVSGSAGVETLYCVQLFVTELLTPEASAQVIANPLNRWVSEPEIRRHSTAPDRKPISTQVETVLTHASVLPVKEEYDLFVSYAHADDTDEFVTALVQALQEEHQQFARDPLRIFFDRNAIHTAHDWEHRLLHGLKAAKAMLAVLSPAYFNSPWCWREWETFIEHEKSRAWPGDPLTPVYALDVPGFDGPHAEEQRAWLAELLRSQYCDLKPWRPIGVAAFRNEEVRKRLQAVDQWLSERLRRVERIGASPSTTPPHNRNFVGREDDLRRVREQLAFGRVTAVTAVSGIGGIGKSALAAEYSHLFADDYPGGRFWLPSEGQDDLRDLLRLLESPLGLTFTDDERKDRDRGYQRVRAELESRPGTLVVLDNVSKLALFDPAHLSRYRPDGNRVHILLTTRDEPPADPERLVVTVPLDRLNPEDGRKLLGRYRDLGADDVEWHAAREIVAALGGHALSLEVVGVYLWRHPEVRYQDYRDWLREEGLLAAAEGAGRDPLVKLSRHPETVVSKLLKPTLDALTEIERRAVEYASLLPAEWVVMPWLRELVQADFPDALKRAKPWLPDPWAVLVGRLKSLRLVVPGEDARLAKMHRVVQAVVIGRMDQAEQDARRQKLEEFSIDRGQFLKTEWYKATARWEIEPLHQFCLHQLDHGRTQGANLASWIGEPLWLLSRFPDARRLYRRAIEIGEKHFDADHPNLAIRYSNLGNVESDLGNLAEARRLYRRAIEIEEKHFDADHPNLAIRYSNLGTVERDLGNLAEARRLYRRAIEIEEKHFDADHPNLAIYCSNLGNVESDLGNLAEARRLYRRAIEIEEKHFDADHPNLAISYWCLAMVEMDEGNVTSAIELMRKSYRSFQTKLGPDHPNTKRVRDWLAKNDSKFDPIA